MSRDGLETAINTKCMQLAALSIHDGGAYEIWSELQSLIAQRSDERVVEMEVERGLR